MKRILILLSVITALTGNIFMLQANAQELKSNYVRLQYVAPIGEYSDYYSAGFGAEYGKHFYFKTLLFGVVQPGIDLTFVEFAINFGDRYNYNEQMYLLGAKIKRNGIDSWFYSDDGFLSTLSVKLGPVITYNIVDDLFADFYIKYAPSLVWGSRTMYFITMDNYHTPVDDPSSMFVSFAHRLSVGLNLKYNFFTFGLEFLFGKSTLDFGDEIVPDAIIPKPAVGDTYKLTDKKPMGLNTIKINVGYLF